MNSKLERRTPAQERSRKRVEAILKAAKSLISEKGSAQLKIHEIAERAGVTPASIYQYFPSKNAITHALAEQLFEGMHALMVDRLPKTVSEEQAYDVIRELVEALYQVYLDDPALYDVWVSISADKSIHDMDVQDSRRTAGLVYECLKPYHDEGHWEQLSQVSFLLAHLAGAAVRMAMTLDPHEGRAVVDSFKSLLNPAFVNTMLENQSAAEK